jgi:hypothetical protein
MIVGRLVVLASSGIAADATNRVLRHGPIPDDARQKLEDLLAERQAMSGFAWALKSERAYANDAFRSLNVGPLRPWWFKHDQADMLARLAQELEVGARPQYEAAPLRERFAPADAELGTLTKLSISSWNALREGQDRERAMIACLRVLNALQSLNEVVAPDEALAKLSLPAEAKTDPFTGQALHVKNVAGEWLIYSVGKDLKDDGGKIGNQTDIGIGPMRKAHEVHLRE